MPSKAAISTLAWWMAGRDMGAEALLYIGVRGGDLVNANDERIGPHNKLIEPQP